jgi:hypothetical protein
MFMPSYQGSERRGNDMQAGKTAPAPTAVHPSTAGGWGGKEGRKQGVDRLTYMTSSQLGSSGTDMMAVPRDTCVPEMVPSQWGGSLCGPSLSPTYSNPRPPLVTNDEM